MNHISFLPHLLSRMNYFEDIEIVEFSLTTTLSQVNVLFSNHHEI